MKKSKITTLMAVIMIILGNSCATVRPYQKNKLNDAEMELSARKIERGDMSFQTYREGSSGANGGKAGGGCGCN